MNSNVLKLAWHDQTVGQVSFDSPLIHRIVRIFPVNTKVYVAIQKIEKYMHMHIWAN